MRRFRRRFNRSRGAAGTSLRWVASFQSFLEVAAGGPTSFDLTPGAPSAHWQSGTTEPTLLRIRGCWGALPRTATAVTQGGVREHRRVAAMIYWGSQGLPTLDPFASADLASERVLWYDEFVLDTRDFAIPAAAAPANPFTVLIAGPGVIHLPVDVKARRRVRTESDRLIIAFRARELFTQSTPPETQGSADVSAMAYWGLRFLYRTHR